ncbi:hypothetical protein RCL1_000526 [Eukaryota sp. TZLM3-RCL]
MTKDSAISQQQLTGWSPVPSLRFILYLFASLSIFCFVLGLSMLISSFSTTELVVPYSSDCDSISCNLSLELSKSFSSPVRLYFELKGFHQNHRRYINSYSRNQLFGRDASESSIKSDCQPLSELDDVLLNPCGLVPNTLFNDTFSLSFDNSPVAIDTDNTIWPRDQGKYRSIPEQSVDVNSGLFISWIKPSLLSKFRKLYGIVHDDLQQGTYSLLVSNNFPVDSFSGSKSFVISESGFFGGRSFSLAILLLILSPLLAGVFVLFWKSSENGEYSRKCLTINA